MEPPSLVEYESLVNDVAERYSISRGALLEAEHGARNDSLGGGCIGHTHVNLIPRLGHLVPLLDGSLDAVPNVQKLSDLMTSDLPYILMRAGQDIRMYDARKAKSQLIRRKITEHFGRDDWDWGLFPHLESVATTVDMWNRP
jgi:hypothetical protein